MPATDFGAARGRRRRRPHNSGWPDPTASATAAAAAIAATLVRGERRTASCGAGGRWIKRDQPTQKSAFYPIIQLVWL